MTKELEKRRTKLVHYEIQRLGIVSYLGVQARKIKPVENEVFVDLAEVLVPFGGQKPRYPLHICSETSTSQQR
jgi:hypothetical protein